MDRKRWKYALVMFVTFLLVGAWSTYDQGMFSQIRTKGAALILALAILMVGLAIYFFVKNLDDPDQPFD